MDFQAEAKELGRLVFEDTCSETGLLMMHERARKAVQGLDPAALERAYATPGGRAAVMQTLIQVWDKADFGLRDDWLVATVWTLDRMRRRKCACRSPADLRTADSKDLEVDLWAVLLMVLKQSEAETELDANMKVMLQRLYSIAFERQNRKRMDSKARDKLWSEIVEREMRACRLLDFQLAAPSPMELLAWVAEDVAACAKLIGRWKFPLAEVELLEEWGCLSSEQANRITSAGEDIVLIFERDGKVEIATDKDDGAGVKVIRTGVLQPAGSCRESEEGFGRAAPQPSKRWALEICWERTPGADPAGDQQLPPCPVMMRDGNLMLFKDESVPENGEDDDDFSGNLLILERREEDMDEASMLRRAWTGLASGKVHFPKVFPDDHVNAAKCPSNPEFPRFMLLAAQLLQLGLVHAPLEEIYGDELPPAALPLAALRLSLAAFRDEIFEQPMAAPAPCRQRLEALAHRLMDRPGEASRLHRLESALRDLWEAPPKGPDGKKCAVAARWSKRGLDGLLGGMLPTAIRVEDLPALLPRAIAAGDVPETPKPKVPHDSPTPAKGLAPEATGGAGVGNVAPHATGNPAAGTAEAKQPASDTSELPAKAAASTSEDKENVPPPSQQTPPPKPQRSSAPLEESGAAPPQKFSGLRELLKYHNEQASQVHRSQSPKRTPPQSQSDSICASDEKSSSELDMGSSLGLSQGSNFSDDFPILEDSAPEEEAAEPMGVAGGLQPETGVGAAPDRLPSTKGEATAEAPVPEAAEAEPAAGGGGAAPAQEDAQRESPQSISSSSSRSRAPRAAPLADRVGDDMPFNMSQKRPAMQAFGGRQGHGAQVKEETSSAKRRAKSLEDLKRAAQQTAAAAPAASTFEKLHAAVTAADKPPQQRRRLTRGSSKLAPPPAQIVSSAVVPAAPAVPPAASNAIALARRQLVTLSSGSNSEADQPHLHPSWWDGTWAVTVVSALRQSKAQTIKVRNLKFKYDGLDWAIKIEDGEVRMVWPYAKQKVPVTQTLKNRERKEADGKSKEVITWMAEPADFTAIIWEKAIIQTRNSVSPNTDPSRVAEPGAAGFASRLACAGGNKRGRPEASDANNGAEQPAKGGKRLKRLPPSKLTA